MGVDVLFLSWDAEVQHFKRVHEQMLLHPVIQGSIAVKAGRVVDLQQPRSAVAVQHDIEAQDLEVHHVLGVVWLAGLEDVG